MPMPTPEAIMRHYDSDPDENPWVRGKPAPESIAIVAYDPEWPARYDGLASTCAARWARLPWTSST
ncbi:hypothetical protein WJ970_15355 [Achromobacter xylosoxidans]